jgi:hypothetical protein
MTASFTWTSVAAACHSQRGDGRFHSPHRRLAVSSRLPEPRATCRRRCGSDGHADNGDLAPGERVPCTDQPCRGAPPLWRPSAYARRYVLVMRSAACALLVTLLLVACGTGQPVRRTWFASTCGQPPLLQHPTEISISCDGNVVLQHLRWSNWGTGTASGTGSIDIGGGCVPNCAQQPVYTYPVTIRVNEIATCPRQPSGLWTTRRDDHERHRLPRPTNVQRQARRLRLGLLARPQRTIPLLIVAGWRAASALATNRSYGPLEP